MNIYFDVTRTTSDLAREVWRFVTLDNALVVESYRVESRPSRRHQNYRVERAYERLSYNHSRHQTPINEADVPLPDDVVEEARREFMSRVRIGFWKPSGR